MRRRRPSIKPQLMCLGCGCTDLHACLGGCHWVQPGICSTCEPQTAAILKNGGIAKALVEDNFKRVRRLPGRFRIMSLAVLSWLWSEEKADSHLRRLRDGMSLSPFTTMRVGRTGLSYHLTYVKAEGRNTITLEDSYRLRFSKKIAPR